MKNSFFGVMAQQQSTADLAAMLTRMAKCADTGESRKTKILGSSGISVADSVAERCLVDDDTVIGSISGDPYWSDDELEAIRQKSGLSKSISEAYRRTGFELVRMLRGPFAIALMDTAKKQTMLAIDRMGLFQLHYSTRGESSLAFASEARHLDSIDGQTPRVKDQAIYDYLYFHMVPSPGTIFEDRFKLQPGERIVWQDGKLSHCRYWAPDFTQETRSHRGELEGELNRVLRQSIKRAADGTETGCFLSGGIDSSTIAGLLSEIQDSAKSFTIGFEEKGYDETSFARLTSTFFKTQQQEYFVTPADVVDILPAIARAYDEPFGNSSVVPTYFCAKMAKESGIETLLGGDGGDELFAGNVRYVTQQIFGIYDRMPGLLKSAILDPVALKLPGAERFMPTRKLRSYVRQAQVPMPDRLETYNYFNRSPVESILHSDFMARIDPTSPAKALRATYDSSGASSMLDKMLELDWKITLADNDIRKVSTMCDLAGISVRYPFLDDDVVALSARVPASMKISRYRLRHFFKHAMRDYLPREVLKKSKHGFGLPFGVWMKTYKPLQELAYDCLSDIGKRNIIRPDYLNQLIGAHQSEHAHYYGEFIWVLMMLELWLVQHDVRFDAGSTN